jgi:hypothetical protein
MLTQGVVYQNLLCFVLVQVIDYHPIMPLLEDWSTEMVHYSGCCLDVLFFTDGKPWKMAQPGRGIMGFQELKCSMCCRLSCNTAVLRSSMS